jgi:hypothetical protein
MRHVSLLSIAVLAAHALSGCASEAADGPGHADAALAQADAAQADAADHADAGAGDTQADSAPPTPDVAEDTGPFVQAKHPAPPKVSYFGNGLLLAPQLVTVTFPGDALAKDLATFAAGIGKSAYWNEVTQGYCASGGSGDCIGPATDGGHVELKVDPAATYADTTDGSPSSLQDFLLAELDNADLPAPATDTLYLLYFPKTTKITLGSGSSAPPSKSCKDFGGYHHSIVYKGTPVAYAVIPECGGKFSSLTALQIATNTASHEILEAVTDPFTVLTQDGYATGYQLTPTTPSLLAWYLALHGGEVGDLCEDILGEGQSTTESDGFLVQRIWSNLSAAAGHDPCVPAPIGQPYFNAAPIKGKNAFQLSVGESVTFSVVAYSDAPVPGGWTVRGVDMAGPEVTGGDGFLDIQVNGQESAQVQNGDTLEVTVTLNADPGTSQPGASAVLLSTGKGGVTHLWPLWFYTPAEAKKGI